MTTLETHLTMHPTPYALARLQMASVEDVAEADCAQAVKFLEGKP